MSRENIRRKHGIEEFQEEKIERVGWKRLMSCGDLPPGTLFRGHSDYLHRSPRSVFLTSPESPSSSEERAARMRSDPLEKVGVAELFGKRRFPGLTGFHGSTWCKRLGEQAHVAGRRRFC